MSTTRTLLKKEIDDAAGKEAGGEKWKIVSGRRKATLETLRIKCCQMMIASGKGNLWLTGRGMGKEQEMVIEGAQRAEFFGVGLMSDMVKRQWRKDSG